MSWYTWSPDRNFLEIHTGTTVSSSAFSAIKSSIETINFTISNPFSIESTSFRYFDLLKRVFFPCQEVTISSYAFQSNPLLETVEFALSPTVFSGAFTICPKLQLSIIEPTENSYLINQIFVSNGVLIRGAFLSDHFDLDNSNFPNIGLGCFLDSPLLTSISFTTTPSACGDSIFTSKVKTASFPPTQQSSMIHENHVMIINNLLIWVSPDYIGEFSIPEGVTGIVWGGCARASKMTSLIIPKTLLYINGGTFLPELEKVYFETGSNPSIYQGTFNRLSLKVISVDEKSPKVIKYFEGWTSLQIRFSTKKYVKRIRMIKATLMLVVLS